jgi:fucose permease
VLSLGFSSFLVFGVVLVLVGANQPQIARDLGLGLGRSGLLASVLALGLGVGVVASGPLVDRRGRGPLFVASCALAAAALLAADPHMSFAQALGELVLVGIALGVQETLLNTAIGESYGAHAPRALLVAHAAATLGAVLAPPALGWLGTHAHWTAGFRATGAAYCALAAAGIATRFPAPPARGPRGGSTLAAALSPALAPFALVAFAYVGVETALTLFAVPYATQALHLDAARGLSAISAFWLGLLLGRVALLAVRREIDARFLVAAGLAGAAALAGGAASGSRALALVFGLDGLALGFVFPVMMALAGHRLAHARGSATGLVAGAGALGGFAVPWLHGVLGDHVGVGAALGLLSVWCAVLAAAAAVAARGGASPRPR